MEFKTHMRPLRPAGDAGVMRWVGPRLGESAALRNRRISKVLKELLFPLAVGSGRRREGKGGGEVEEEEKGGGQGIQGRNRRISKVLTKLLYSLAVGVHGRGGGLMRGKGGAYWVFRAISAGVRQWTSEGSPGRGYTGARGAGMGQGASVS